MHKTTLMMCCSAALVLGVVGCNPQSTDDTLTDEATRPVEAVPPADTTTPATGTTTAPVAAAMLSVATGASGQYLTDIQGRAVYLLEGDTDGSKCTAACLEAWPPVRAEGEAATAAAAPPGATGTADTTAGLRTDLLGTVQRADGVTQVTYNGHPLYRYAKDTGSSTSGQGVKDQWGEWYLVGPDGEAVDVES